MSYKDGFVHLANRIEPDSGLRERVLALGEQAPRRRRTPVLKYAVSFVLAAAVLAGGALCWPMQPVRKDMGSLSVAVPQTGFTVVANAATTGGSSQAELKPGLGFQIAKETDDDNMISVGAGRGDKTKSEEMMIAGIRLKCVGNKIQKVTYTVSRGDFQQLVALNAVQKAYYSSFRRLLSSDAKLILRTTESAYSEVGNSLEAGSDYDGMLYLKEQTTITDMTWREIEHAEKYTGAIPKRLFDGVKIKISVLFQDGTQSEKTVELSYPEREPFYSGHITATLLK